MIEPYGTVTPPNPLRIGLNRLSLQPGDVLLVQLPKNITQEGFAITTERIDAAMPAGVTPLYVCGDIGFTLMRMREAEKHPVEPEHDAATIVEVAR